MTTAEAGDGIPIYNKINTSLEGLKIVAGLIIKDRTDARKHGIKILLLLTDATRSFPESDNMSIYDIL